MSADRNRFYRCSSGALVNIAESAEELVEALLRGSPGWIETPAGQDLISALNAAYEEAE